jgi:uncharacterized membrane protein YeaQ/YmgE (transglycosylase-associated protein family)
VHFCCQPSQRLRCLDRAVAHPVIGVVLAPGVFRLQEAGMTITLPGLIVLIIIAAICGAVGRALGGGARGGLIVSTAIGFIGAVLGPWVARYFHLAEPLVLRAGGYSFPIVWSIIGGALFVALLHLLSGRRRMWS